MEATSESSGAVGPFEPAPAEAAADEARYRDAFERALRLLGQREHSVRELVRKLTGKGIDADTARLVVDDLRGRGLQSDARFAEAFVYGRVGRAQGPLRIRRELALRGIDDDTADAVLTREADFWMALAARARTRKFGGGVPDDRNAWNRQARFLAQRGFPSDLIFRVLGDAD